MKNVDEYIEKAKSLGNARPLITTEELSAMLDSREAAQYDQAGSSLRKGWQKFILPTFSAIMVLIAVLSSTHRSNETLHIIQENPVKISEPWRNAPGESNSENTSPGTMKNKMEMQSGSLARKSERNKTTKAEYAAIDKDRPAGRKKTGQNVRSDNEGPAKNITFNESTPSPTESQPRANNFDADSFRAEQRNMMDSLLAARLSRIDSLLAMRRPSEPRRVDTLFIKEIISQNPLKVDFRHSISINFWLMKDNIYEVQWEYAPLERWSFTIKGGYGSLLGSDKIFKTNTGIEQKSPYDLIIIGSKVAYYLLGDFEHGVQAGLDATYYATSYNVARSAGPYEEGRGLNLTPFIGYKVILSPGYTLNAQAGYGMKYHNKFEGVRDGAGVYQGYIRSIFKPTYVFNVNFGWSL
ncbi:MAG: hypothetical protein ACM3U1_07985 [Chloroflexota bacterium]